MWDAEGEAMTKTILITGGSRGIGAASARLAGQRGWSVAVNYVGNSAAADETVAAVAAAGGKAIAIKGDVASEGDVAGLFAETTRLFGPIDGVVNNAGILEPAMPLAEMTADRLLRIITVNVFGAYLLAREAVRSMGKSHGGRGGSLVNLSSVAAKLGGPGEFVDYAGTKGAVESMTTGLSKELGPEGIRVNAIRPGLIDTDIHASGGTPDRAKRLGPSTPAGRYGTAEEVGEAIVWLLSDQAAYVSGAILDVSGGR
jgi:NAD(P)-dependent dehydrogenase (short-subunit alcohol dehydrogenase family)